MEERILALEKTLGGLRQVYLGNEKAFRLETIDNYRLTASVKTIRVWLHYGSLNENRLTLSLDGKQDDIVINGTTIDHVVKDVHKFYNPSNRRDCSHSFTLNWKTPEGYLAENTFDLACDDMENDSLLPHIVYAMLIIAEVKDAQLCLTYWDILTRGSFPIVSPGKNLDNVSYLKQLGDKLSKEYPFTQKFFQDGMQNAVNFMKKEIEKLGL